MQRLLSVVAALCGVLLLAGCSEDKKAEEKKRGREDDSSVPLLIPCEACKKEVSKEGEACANCSHPVAASIEAYLKNKTSREKIDQAIAEAVSWEGLLFVDDLATLKGELFSGWILSKFENGEHESLERYENGRPDGLSIYWYKSGRKHWEDIWKDGLLISSTTWRPNGDQCQVCKLRNGNGIATSYHENGQVSWKGTYKDGNLDGPCQGWYENGQVSLKEIYKEGKMWSLDVWKPNGEKCPLSNIRDGNGLVVQYSEDGTAEFRETYKDGEVVEERPRKPISVNEWNGTFASKEETFIENMEGNVTVLRMRDGNEPFTGKVTIHGPNGERRVFRYREGKKHGLCTIRDTAGARTETNYLHGVEHGLHVQFGSDGKERFRWRYENGKMVRE